MFVLIVFFCYVICASCQTATFGKLKIVSDLLPEQCFVQDLNYVEVDPSDDLPRCSPFDNAAGICAQFRSSSYDLINKPTCAKDGQFAPIQCKGERATGRCFCSDSSGKRIFGQEWWTKADNMTCACSRKKADLADSEYFNSLHCTRAGNYEPLQCDVVSGQCWCANETTGELTSPVVPEKAMSKLPCYTALTTGTQYLRQCESKKHAYEKITLQLRQHGTAVHFQDYLCDDDGSYGAFKIIDGSAYCSWRDNSNIGSYQAGNNHTGVNCNCARDTKIFGEVGKEQTQKCSANGNYEEFQTIKANTYCVDVDGYRKSPLGVNVEDGSNCVEYLTYN